MSLQTTLNESTRYKRALAVGAEVKIFEDIASQLGAKKGDVGTKVFNDVEGKIKLKTELCPCGSCSGVIEPFKNMFPKVELEILAQPKSSF